MPNTIYTIESLRNWEEATRAEPQPIRLAVVGDPVAHSLSPQMHNAVLEAWGESVGYGRLHILPDQMEEALELAGAARFIGLNITIPHKQAVMGLMDEVTDQARAQHAVNTVLFDGGKTFGSSTDGPGFVRAVREEFQMDVRDLRVVLLGAGGGAGRSIAVQCALERCARLVLVNRTLERATKLAHELAPRFSGSELEGAFGRLDVVPWESAALQRVLPDVDLIVNATSLGMRRTDPELLPASALMPYHLVYDTVYSGGETALLRATHGAGARAANGLSMLLHQGVLSLETWFGKTVPVEVMRKSLLAAAAGR